MAEIAEYEYEPKLSHLTSEEALERYDEARKDYPDALVTLRDLECGHWQVQVLTTEDQKEDYLRDYLAEGISRIFAVLRKSIR